LRRLCLEIPAYKENYSYICNQKSVSEAKKGRLSKDFFRSGNGTVGVARSVG
jgi:hypothetical protein